MYPLPPAHVTRRALRPREKLEKPRRVPCPSQPAAPNTEVEPTIPIPLSLSLSVGNATETSVRCASTRPRTPFLAAAAINVDSDRVAVK